MSSFAAIPSWNIAKVAEDIQTAFQAQDGGKSFQAEAQATVRDFKPSIDVETGQPIPEEQRNAEKLMGQLFLELSALGGTPLVQAFREQLTQVKEPGLANALVRPNDDTGITRFHAWQQTQMRDLERGKMLPKDVLDALQELNALESNAWEHVRADTHVHGTAAPRGVMLSEEAIQASFQASMKGHFLIGIAPEQIRLDFGIQSTKSVDRTGVGIGQHISTNLLSGQHFHDMTASKKQEAVGSFFRDAATGAFAVGLEEPNDSTIVLSPKNGRVKNDLLTKDQFQAILSQRTQALSYFVSKVSDKDDFLSKSDGLRQGRGNTFQNTQRSLTQDKPSAELRYPGSLHPSAFDRVFVPEALHDLAVQAFDDALAEVQSFNAAHAANLEQRKLMGKMLGVFHETRPKYSNFNQTLANHKDGDYPLKLTTKLFHYDPSRAPDRAVGYWKNAEVTISNEKERAYLEKNWPVFSPKFVVAADPIALAIPVRVVEDGALKVEHQPPSIPWSDALRHKHALESNRSFQQLPEPDANLRQNIIGVPNTTVKMGSMLGVRKVELEAPNFEHAVHQYLSGLSENEDAILYVARNRPPAAHE